MDAFVVFLARGLIALLQKLPLRWVARLGRWCGALAYMLDVRHRNVALRNLALCFGREKSIVEIRSIARENFRRLGENFASALKTADMGFEQIQKHVEFYGPLLTAHPQNVPRPKVVAAIGHFGNFELYARVGQFAPGTRPATTYRALRQAGLNQLFQDLRQRSGCQYFERRFDAGALKAFMNQSGALLGLLSDQHAGDGGLRLPFLGHDCSTSAAPALFALRYDCALITAICYRVGLAKWRIEVGEPIATRIDDKPRSTADIMIEVNQAFEAAVRRDPANWFWVHNRWKPRKPRTVFQPAPQAAEAPESDDATSAAPGAKPA